jgi:putative PIN family toxin of toxin-antitoxin system
VNVIVAAVVRPDGTAANCMRAHAEGRFDLVVSPLLLDELRTVLRREKFRPFLAVNEADRLVEALSRDATVVADTETEPVSRDPRDDYLVALARAAGAHVLVTGDRDLLDIELPDLKIAPPAEFLALLPD